MLYHVLVDNSMSINKMYPSLLENGFQIRINAVNNKIYYKNFLRNIIKKVFKLGRLDAITIGLDTLIKV